MFDITVVDVCEVTLCAYIYMVCNIPGYYKVKGWLFVRVWKYRWGYCSITI